MNLPIRLSKNLDFDTNNNLPRYFLNIDLDEIAAGRVATLLVHWRSNGFHPILKEIYSTEVGGFRIEKGNLPTLTEAVQDTIGSLVAYRTFPYYSMELPGNIKVPVFLIKDKLRMEYGPIHITGESISEVHQKMSKQLLSAKEIRSKDDLKVSLFLWADLRLYPTAFVVRDPRDRIWFPIFAHDGQPSGALIFDLLNQPSKIFGVTELPAILNEISRHLLSIKGGSRPEHLFLDQVRDDFWAELRKAMVKEKVWLKYESKGQRREISVYRLSKLYVAADRPRIYFGADRDKMRDVVAESLKEDRLVPSTTSVTIEKRRS
jgi:hypothetical protein